MVKLKNNKLLNIIKKKSFNPANFGYEFYWQNRVDNHVDGIELARHKAIVKYLDASSTVLDLACGDGTLLRNINKQLTGMTVSGVDVSATAIDLCDKQGLKVSKGNIDDANFKVDGQYDYIIISEALEHIVNPEGLLQKLKNHYGKSIIVTIPNTGYFMHRLSLLFGTFPVQWIDHPSEHLRFWTLSDFKHTLAILGYQNHRLHSIKGVRFLENIWPSMFSQQTLFILKPQSKQ